MKEGSDQKSSPALLVVNRKSVTAPLTKKRDREAQEKKNSPEKGTARRRWEAVGSAPVARGRVGRRERRAASRVPDWRSREEEKREAGASFNSRHMYRFWGITPSPRQTLSFDKNTPLTL